MWSRTTSLEANSQTVYSKYPKDVAFNVKLPRLHYLFYGDWLGSSSYNVRIAEYRWCLRSRQCPDIGLALSDFLVFF